MLICCARRHYVDRNFSWISTWSCFSSDRDAPFIIGRALFLFISNRSLGVYLCSSHFAFVLALLCVFKRILYLFPIVITDFDILFHFFFYSFPSPSMIYDLFPSCEMFYSSFRWGKRSIAHAAIISACSVLYRVESDNFVSTFPLKFCTRVSPALCKYAAMFVHSTKFEGFYIAWILPCVW